MSQDLRRFFDRDPTPDPCEPKMEVVERPDVVLWHRPSATGSPWTSGVLHYRWTPEEADSRIDWIMRFFADRNAAFSWHVPDDGEPADLGARLEARGFHLDGRAEMLVATLPILGLRVNPSIEVREVADERTLRDSVLVQHPDWDAATQDALVRERRAYLACPGHPRQFAVAYLDDVAVAAARWHFDTRYPVIALTGAETLAAHRNRGAYSTLVAYRGARGMEHACLYATIQADVTTSAPILRRRGFTSVGTAAFYVSPERRSSSS